jgi:hypothetical protein
MLTPAELQELTQLADALQKTLAAIRARYAAEAQGSAQGYPAPKHGSRIA